MVSGGLWDGEWWCVKEKRLAFKSDCGLLCFVSGCVA